MKKITIFITLIICITLTGIANASRFTIVNHSGMDIYELYVSPASREIWGTDLLHGRILKNRQYCSIVWKEGKRKMWDMTAQDATGESITWVGIDVTDVVKIRLDPVYAHTELRIE